MATPAPVAPAAPTGNEAKPAANGTIAPADGTKPAIDATKPPVPEPKGDTLEAELEAKWGEDWKALKGEMKQRIIATERKSRDADKQYQAVAQIKKQYDLNNAQMAQVINAIKSDPVAVLKNPALGHDLKKLALDFMKEAGSSPEIRKAAEEIVWSAYQEERMTPEQRQARANASRLKQFEDQERQRAETAKTEQQKAMNAAVLKKLDETFTSALKEADLPKSTWTIQRMVHWYKVNRRANVPIDMKSITDRVKGDYETAAVDFFRRKMESRPKESRLEGLDPAVIKLIREADLHSLRAKGLAPKPGPKSNGAAPKSDSLKKKTMSDWLNERDDRLGRK